MGEAHAWLDWQYEQVFTSPFYENARWVLPVSPELVDATSTGYANPDSYPVDARGVSYSFAYFSPKRMGAGQFYLMTIKDTDGNAFDGATTYRLHVPANVPVHLYWSATAYTAPPTPSSGTCAGPADPQTRPVCTSKTTGQWFCSSGPSRQMDVRATGSRRARTVSSRCCAASTGRRNPCSTRPGGCPTSNGCTDYRSWLKRAARQPVLCRRYDELRESRKSVADWPLWKPG